MNIRSVNLAVGRINFLFEYLFVACSCWLLLRVGLQNPISGVTDSKHLFYVKFCSLAVKDCCESHISQAIISLTTISSNYS